MTRQLSWIQSQVDKTDGTQCSYPASDSRSRAARKLPDLAPSSPEKNRIKVESNGNTDQDPAVNSNSSSSHSTLPPFIKCDLEWYDGKDGINCKAKQVYAFVDGKCVEKTYGGCGGNANRFESLKECEDICGGHVTQP